MNLSALIVGVTAIVTVVAAAIMFCWFVYACWCWLGWA